MLVAVTKTVTMDVIRALVEAGLTELGESRVQELVQRAAQLVEEMPRSSAISAGPTSTWTGSPDRGHQQVHWHLVGHLQRNKVKQVLPWVSLIHSVDSLRLAEDLDVHSQTLKRKTAILLEVNAGDEPQKSGVAVAAAMHLAEQIVSLPHLDLRGLMAMAPLTDDVDRIKSTFRRARELYDEMAAARFCGPRFKELSFGMSSDFEYGIEAGATIVRIGTALFEGMETSTCPTGLE